MKGLMQAVIYHVFPASILDLAWRIALMFFSLVVAYVTDLNVSNSHVVASIVVIYSADWILGTVLAIREGDRFRLNKFMEKPGHMFGCWLIFMMAASMEKFAGYGWIVEGVMFPILFFQFLDALDNAQKLGILKDKVSKYVAQKYHKYLKEGDLSRKEVRGDE